MNWFSKIINTYQNGLKYEQLQINSIICNDFNMSLLEHNEELLKIEEKYYVVKDTLKKILEKKVINILEFEEYYESKKEKSSWLHPYLGDRKLRNVIGALRDSVVEEKKLRAEGRKLIDKYSLTKEGGPELVIEKIIQHFRIKSHWKYLKDSQNIFGDYKSEFWQKAVVSLQRKSGDCEDLAILMHNLIYYIFDILDLKEHYWRLELCGWVLVSAEGGHVLNCWLGNDGEYYAVESTYDLTGSFQRTWLKTPLRYNNLYAKPMGWARKDKSWHGSLSSLQNVTGGEK